MEYRKDLFFPNLIGEIIVEVGSEELRFIRHKDVECADATHVSHATYKQHRVDLSQSAKGHLLIISIAYKSC